MVGALIFHPPAGGCVCVWNIWRDVKLLTLEVSFSAVSWISLSLIFNTERSWFSYSAVVSIFPEHQFQQGEEGSPDVASANEAPHWMIRKTYLQWGRPGHWDMQLVTYTSDVESLYRVSQHWFASAPRGFMYLHRRVLRKLICFLSNLHVYRTQFLMDLFKDPILSSVCTQ